MNEARWLACTDPLAMLKWLDTDRRWQPDLAYRTMIVTDRRKRLFACACCRLSWDSMPDPRSRRAVEVAEAYADGRASLNQLQTACAMAWAACTPGTPGMNVTTYRQAAWASDSILVAAIKQCDEQAQQPTRAAILRDVMGSPFVEVIPSVPCRRCGGLGTVEVCEGAYPDGTCPVCDGNRRLADLRRLEWNDGAISKMAQAVYDERDFGQLPMMADMMERAGLDGDSDLVMHCRGLEREVCGRCDGDGQAAGSDRPFEWSPDADYGKCVVCKGSGLSGQWTPLRHTHVHGCWAVDVARKIGIGSRLG